MAFAPAGGTSATNRCLPYGAARRGRLMSTQSARWIATARLLRRTGFGTIGPTVDAVAGQDWSLYLDRVLGLDAGADSGAIATPMPTYPEAPKYPGKDAPR